MKDLMNAATRKAAHGRATFELIVWPAKRRQLVKGILWGLFVALWMISCNLLIDDRCSETEAQHQAYFEATGQN